MVRLEICWLEVLTLAINLVSSLSLSDCIWGGLLLVWLLVDLELFLEFCCVEFEGFLFVTEKMLIWGKHR